MGKTLVTGSAGFIGAAVTKQLLSGSTDIVGIDNLNSYYDISLKHDRLAELSGTSYVFQELDVSNEAELSQLFEQHQFECVIHLAAQAGVRYSIENPHAYGKSNLTGFLNILENCRQHGVRRLVYASSSSVYGDDSAQPFSETEQVHKPLSLYAATKKSNELMAHSYAHLYGLEVVGLRFFTVYGPWGRPDMAPMLFAKAISAGEPIKVFNHGNCRRDFTYIDDIVDGILKAADYQMPNSAAAPYEVFNIGRGEPVDLMEFINILEELLGKPAKKVMLPAQPGDVEETWASIAALQSATAYNPKTSLAQGLEQFVSWFKRYYQV